MTKRLIMMSMTTRFYGAVMVFISGIATIQAQYVLEHSYPNASHLTSPSGHQQLYVIKLEVSGEKFVVIDRDNKEVRLYNLDHSLFKTISLSNATWLNTSNAAQDILYISEHLFDIDDEVELLYADQMFSALVTQIINEDGVVLFTVDDGLPACRLNMPQTQVPIYNTAGGTKLLISMANGEGRVYGLPGTLSISISPNPAQERSETWVYPNPASQSITLNLGEIQDGAIRVFDDRGRVLIQESLSLASTIQLNIEGLGEGEYFFCVFNKRGVPVETGRFIKY